MGFISRIFGPREKSTTTSERPASWFVDWIRGGENTSSGISVTPQTAMRLAAVWACVRVRSEDIGKLPCHLYKRLPNGGKQRDTKHPLYKLIHDAPNPRMTAFDFKQLLQAHVDTNGNGYALKEFDERGANVIALWPVNDPKKVTVHATPDGKDLFYKIGSDEKLIPAEGVLHLRGFSLDGMVGMSPITHHRETIGLAMAAEKYGSAFFGNSAQPRGIVKVKGIIDEPNAARLRENWEQKYRGIENSHKIAILDGGMEWIQTGMSNADAQYIDLRKMQNEEIWRIYRMPPHKVGDLSRSTNNNIEHQGLEYVSDCLMSEMVRWEQTLCRDLLTDKEQETHFFEFLPDALLRGDLKSRYEAYAVGRNWGWLSVNDIKDFENQNHVKNGDIYLQPLNMVEAGTPPPPVAPGITPDGAKALLSLAHELVARAEAAAEQAA